MKTKHKYDQEIDQGQLHRMAIRHPTGARSLHATYPQRHWILSDPAPDRVRRPHPSTSG